MVLSLPKDTELIEKFEIKLNVEELKTELRLNEKPDYISQLAAVANEALSVADPKAIIKEINNVEFINGYVRVNSQEFKSRVLELNLKKSKRVFAVIVTAGAEIEEWTHKTEDILVRYWSDVISNNILQQAIAEVDCILLKGLDSEFVSWMTPGSLPDWPIMEQKKLFELFEKDHLKIGVTLTEQLIMTPAKTMSGLVFASNEKFYSCQLCNKTKCDKRRADYLPSLAKDKYGIENTELA